MPRRSTACRDFDQLHGTRRTALKLGALGLSGLTLSRLLRAEASDGALKPTARSCILLFQFGGPSHLDTFDPKPQAPAEIRGEFGVIATRNPQLVICEHLPKLAALADQFSLVRGVHHDRGSHNPGAYYSLTGRKPLSDLVTANAAATDFPCPGAVIDYLRRDDRSDPSSPESLDQPSRGRLGHMVPTAVSLPTMIADGPFRTPGEFAGFLGKLHDPLFITQDPNNPKFSVEQLALPDGVSVERLRNRRDTLSRLAATAKLGEQVAAVRDMDAYQQRAFDLLTAPATQRALAIGEEDSATRDRYGRNQYGQSVLLARRLVEAGVRFVTVYYSAGIGGWDTHKANFKTLKESRLPQTDLALSALLEDLAARGLLDETLVLWTGDFGRTPKVNKDAGRDHWPPCQTVLMAGGGVRPGVLAGSSDKTGAYPLTEPHKPDDLMATVYHCLGVDPATIIHDQLNRPMPIADGQPISALL
ncbi:MAG TPA: DUF1501 domain-containing protein [Pirellulales bacterium]|nr:DUF1501 domain-containing protein [Pirellulales bacterium]